MLDDRRLPGDGYDHLYLDWINGTDRANLLMERPHLGASSLTVPVGSTFEFGITATMPGIVARDETRQIIGWAEFDCKPADQSDVKPR